MQKILRSYLRFWAKIHLWLAKPKIIAVTGSAGKTSTKEVIFAVLKTHYGSKARKSEGNLNTVYGVSLAVLGYKKPPVPLDKPSSIWPWIPVILTAPFSIWRNLKTRVIVLEIAADKPGDVRFITSFIKPDISVITNIGAAHMEIFGSLAKIIEEKTELLKAVKSNGTIILNADDTNLRKFIENGPSNTKTFAISSPAEMTAKNITTEIIDFKPLTNFQIASSKNRYLAQVYTLGREANVYPSLAAALVAEILEIKPREVITALKTIAPQKHRMEVFEGKNGEIILDDTYNANPLSLKAALNVLKVLPAKRKIAILGDMLELGTLSEKAHVLLGEYANQVADTVLSFGPLSKNYGSSRTFLSKDELKDYLLKEVIESGIIETEELKTIFLVKGSRGMAMEDIVDFLKK